MSTNEKLVEQVNAILIKHSEKAMELAKQAVFAEHIKYEQLREALRYFMEEAWYDSSHPTLLSLACEAVGGNPDATSETGAALALLAGAADIHDDIIDQSLTKGSKLTVFGKFGKDIAIIASDVLWLKGVLMLSEASDRFPPEKKQAILKLAKEAFFDIGSAEAKEANLRGSVELEPEEFLEIVKLKVSVGVAAAQIGAIIGNGTSQQIVNLGQYAKTLGVLMTIREDFINMFELEELTNRFKNECLPLPILCAFQDAALKQKIIGLLEKDEITEAKLDEMIEQVYRAPEVRKLGKYMRLSVKEATENMHYPKESQNALIQLLEFTLQDLPGQIPKKKA